MSRRKTADVMHSEGTSGSLRLRSGKGTGVLPAFLILLFPLLAAGPGAASEFAPSRPVTASKPFVLAQFEEPEGEEPETETESEFESEVEEDDEETESEEETETETEEGEAETESEREEGEAESEFERERGYREDMRENLATGSGRDEDFDLDDEGFDVMAREVVAVDPDEGVLERLEDEGYEIVRRDALDGLDLTVVTLRVPEGEELDAAVERVRSALPSGAADYNHIYRTARAGPEPPTGKTPWELAGLLNLNPASRESTPFRVGLIDTAINLEHPSLRRAKIETQNFSGGPSPALRDHGTAVAALLAGQEAGRFSGLAPEAEILAAEVFHQSPDGGPAASADAVMRGLDWLLKEGVRVINISLAGPPNVFLEIAVRKALEQGHILVAAAGNDGPAAPPAWPAAYEGVIAVTAVGADLQIYRRAARGPHIDFAAPGVGVLTARGDGQYGVVDGTSFAAPFVSVLIARHAPASPSPAGLLIEHFRSHSRDLGRRGFDHVFGHGLIQPIRGEQR